ncbi:transposable element Tcb1 transposase [Trichonephila clavipes]|nr:transposable element Tcb1 transposase [Trichonephila clavipes]
MKKEKRKTYRCGQRTVRLADCGMQPKPSSLRAQAFEKRPVLFYESRSRRKQRSAFDQVSEFDIGRIVAYRDCGLSFREIGSRVGQNQTTVMRISDRWMQEGTTDQRGRSHPLQ